MRRTIGALVQVCAVALFGATASAQVPERTLIHVSHVKVKPDMLESYKQFTEKEVIPAYKKTDISWVRAWEVWPYGNGAEMIFAAELKGFAQFDGSHPLTKVLEPEQLQTMFAKIRKHAVGWTTYALERHANLSFETEEQPTAAVLWRADFVPGKTAQALEFMKTEVLPTMKKAGLTHYLVHTTLFGEGPDLQVAAMYKDFASLDQGHPFRRVHDAEKAKQMFARSEQLFLNTTLILLRHLPKLSYDNTSQ